MRRDAFHAMGVAVVVGGATELELAAVWRLFDEWERVFSRFRPDSELNRVNRSRSDVVLVSPLFARVMRVALDAAYESGGLVDPTLGRALDGAGYDRDSSRLGEDPRALGAPAPGAWWEVQLAGRLLTRPSGMWLDLNGVVKAFAVDEALKLLCGHGFVSAGGDVAARGPVAVGLPAGGSVRVRGGGIATSSTAHRRWLRGDERQHHLIDPGTGRPAASRWTEVTVAASTCLGADVAAKAALLLSDGGPKWLDRRGLPGRFSDAETTVLNETWRQAGAATLAAA